MNRHIHSPVGRVTPCAPFSLGVGKKMESQPELFASRIVVAIADDVKSIRATSGVRPQPLTGEPLPVMPD